MQESRAIAVRNKHTPGFRGPAAWLLTGLLAIAAIPATGAAAAQATYQFNLPEQSLSEALKAIGQQTATNILFDPDSVIDRTAPALRATLTASEAIERVLQGTNLISKQTAADTVLVQSLDTKQAVRTTALLPEIGGGAARVGVGSLLLAQAETNSRGSKGADSSEETGSGLEEIVVTASRREQLVKDVPAGISVVNPAEFIAAGLNGLDEIIDYTPGFFAIKSTGPRGSGTDGIVVRGIAPQAGAVASVYLDDSPLTSNNIFAGANSFDGVLFDLERVELIKGPQSTLYGAISLAGTIRYITRKPALKDGRAHASVDLSETKEGGFNKIYSGNISVPIVKDRLGVSLAAFLDDTGGLVDRVDPGTGLVTKKNADSGKTHGLSGDILFQASEALDFRVRALRQKSTFDGFSSVTLENANKVLRYGIANDSRFADRTEEQTFVSAAANYDFGWATLAFNSSYAKLISSNFADVTADFGAFADDAQGFPIGTTTLVSIDSPSDSEKYTQELRLTSVSNKNLEWVAGLYYSDESVSTVQNVVAQPGDFLVAYANFPNKYRDYAAFVNTTYYVTPKFDIGIGSRYSHINTTLRLITDGPLFVDVPSDNFPAAKENVGTYLLTTRYRPTDDMALYARIANGYRPPSANLVFRDSNTGEPLTPLTLKADTLWSYEIGVKGNSANGFFSYDLAAWYVDWKKFKASITVNGLGTRGNAEGGIKAKGFEASFALRPIAGLTLISSVAYADSYLNQDEETLNGLKGQAVPNAPKWTVSGRSVYDFDIASDVTGHVGAGVRYASSVPSTFFGLDPTRSAVNVPSDSYLLVDINGGVHWGSTALNLYVKNVFNSFKLGSAFGDQFGDSFFGSATPLQPRTIGAALSYDF